MLHGTAAKTSGVIIDDMAVTPKFVQGLSPKRELPVIWKITKGSLRNKFLIVIPLLMVLSWILPAALPYLLIVGGSYLAYEGTEKVLSWAKVIKPHHEEGLSAESAEALEKKMVTSAVTTDLVLSIEIMLISLSTIETDNWISKLLMLCIVAIGLTALIYGVVGVLIKMDDIGLHMAQRKSRPIKIVGTGILKAMPRVFDSLSVIGTFAMLWVGGHLLWKSLGDVGISHFTNSLHKLEESLQPYGGIFQWFGETAGSMGFGLVFGLLIFFPIHYSIGMISKFRSSKDTVETH